MRHNRDGLCHKDTQILNWDINIPADLDDITSRILKKIFKEDHINDITYHISLNEIKKLKK